MEYTPRQESSIREAQCLEPGTYEFEVTGAAEKVSKNGNDMIELSLRVFAPDGTTRTMRDWLVPGSDMGDLKLNRFCHATGLQGAYFAGELSAFACGGVSGTLRLTVEQSEQYGTQNRVKDYVVGAVPDETSQVAPETTYESQLAEQGDGTPF